MQRASDDAWEEGGTDDEALAAPPARRSSGGARRLVGHAVRRCVRRVGARPRECARDVAEFVCASTMLAILIVRWYLLHKR
jgi:hypothetical protein